MEIRKPCHRQYVSSQISKIRPQKIRKLFLYGFAFQIDIVFFFYDIIRFVALVVRSEFLAVVCCFSHPVRFLQQR